MPINNPLWFPLLRLGQLLMPLLSIFGLILLSLVNLRITSMLYVSPLILFAGLFYWVLFRPEFFPKWLVFLLGVFQDAVYGFPIGCHTLVLMIFYGVIHNQRKHLMQQPFVLLWMLFGISMLVSSFLLWLTYSLYLSEILPIEPMVVQWLVTCVTYPLLHSLFNLTYVATE